MHSMDEVARLLEAGNMHRAVAAHNLNEHSSRSHAICTVQMEQRLRPGVPSGPTRSASSARSCTLSTWQVTNTAC